MSSFTCEKCGAEVLDSPSGYTTGCSHYPLEGRRKVHIEPSRKSARPPEDLDSELDEDYEEGPNYG